MQEQRIRKHPRRKVIAGALGVAIALAATAATTSPASAHERPLIAGVGDSFISGQGIPPFVQGTDTPTDSCHRSLAAYPNVLGNQLHVPVRNVACSGATTDDLFTTFKTEAPQASRISDASVVLVTIGGNDVDALDMIANPPTAQELAAKLQALAPKLVATYQKLHSAAPHARITVTGYPNLFNTAANPACPLSQQQRTAVVQATQALDSTIAQAAATARVGYADVSNAFTGHELCTAQPWVNGVDQVHPAYSLHPNAAGQQALARAVAPAVHVHRCHHR